MTCYRCGTTENLSIKSQRKSTGYKLMICKDCRNKKARQVRELLRPQPFNQQDEWNYKAMQSLERLSKR